MRRIQIFSALIATTLVPFLAGVCHGMDVRVVDINPVTKEAGAYPTLVLSGEILTGDYERLLGYAIENNLDLHAMSITLATPGGDISEALKIGQLLKSIYATVDVGPVTGPCASACFILYASAVNRSATAGTVGIHRPYLSKERFQNLSPSQAEKLETNALLAAEDYLHKLRVPSSLVDVMFENASSEIHWLTDDELQALGENPAWYEEFLIARCNLNKEARPYYLAHPDDKVVFAKLMEVYGCGKRLTEQEAVSNFEAAKEGYVRQLSPGDAQRLTHAADSHDKVYAALNTDIPNWKQINTSKAFLAWLDDGDQAGANGISTKSLLSNAFEANQKAVVVSIFKAYLRQHSGIADTASAPTPPQLGTSAVSTSTDRWVTFADISENSGGLNTHATWYIDRNSLQKKGSEFSADVRVTATNDGGLPQLRNTISLTRWSVNCSGRSYWDHGGTTAYRDNGQWIPSPYPASDKPVAATPSNKRATQLIEGICTAVYGP